MDIDEYIVEFRDTLGGIVDETNNNPILTEEQIDQIIALMQMLHKANPAGWHIEQCDAFIGQLVSDITTRKLNQAQLRELMTIMAEFGGAEIIDETQMDVEKYRRKFLYLFTTGITFALLQTMFPGLLSFILDSAYALYLALIAQKVTDQQIVEQLASNSSPLSAGPFAAAAAKASANLISAAFYAFVAATRDCVGIGVSVASAAAAVAVDATASAVKAIPSCLEYGTQLLGFALATSVATSGVRGATSAVMGDYDAEIAAWIRSGGPEQFKNTITDAVSAAAKFTKDAVRDAFEGMDEVNRGFNNPDSPPNRFAALHVNEVIAHWLKIYIRKFQGQDIYTILSNIMAALSMIDFDEDEEASIQEAARQLDVQDPTDAGFRALVAVYKLAVDKKQITRRASEPLLDVNATYHPKKKDTGFQTSLSLPEDYKYTSNKYNPLETLHGTKSVARYEVKKPFDSSMEVVSQILPPGKCLLNSVENNNIKQAFINTGTWRQICQLSEKDQENFVNKIKTTSTKRGINDEAEIEAYSNTIKSVLGEDIDTKRPKKGGRKSRRHKKRKSTLKRRRIKRRRTRKGKKRRHTKKR